MSNLRIALVICILILSFILRLHNYAEYPQRGASSDEYSYSFLGVSLLTKHVPISWSYFQVYKHKSDVTIRHLYFPIVYPYFDHTPLNGIVVGSWALLNGENNFEKIQLKTIRLVPIFLSMISSILVFLLGLRLYSYKIALWALFIYSTTTIFVMNGRVVFAENLLTPILLSAIYIFLHFQKRMTIHKSIVLGVFSGLGFWTKELGLCVFFTLLYLFISEKMKLRNTILFSIVSMTFVVLYILYGQYYDGELFWKIIGLQSARDIGPQTLLYIFSTPIIVNKFYNDGWYFLGFLAFFIAFLDYRKNKFLLVPSTIYFLLLIFSLTQKGEMGWYLIPLFPFMALFTAQALSEHIHAKTWFIFIFMLFIGLYEITYLYKLNFGLTATQFRVMMIILFAPLVLASALRKEKLFERISNFWFYIFLLGNVWITYSYIHPA